MKPPLGGFFVMEWAQVESDSRPSMPSKYTRQRGGTRFAHLYGTARWQRVRAAQLARAPLCAMCAARGLTVAATVCDHVNGHPAGETETMFWNGPFQSLCAPCHSGDKARMERGKERRGCDADGWPL